MKHSTCSKNHFLRPSPSCQQQGYKIYTLTLGKHCRRIQRWQKLKGRKECEAEEESQVSSIIEQSFPEGISHFSSAHRTVKYKEKKMASVAWKRKTNRSSSGLSQLPEMEEGGKSLKTGEGPLKFA